MANVDFAAVFDDMRKNPVKYYTALGQRSTKYKQMLSTVSYMSDLQRHNMPEQYTQSSNVYADMQLNPQKYLDVLGGDERKYNAGLQSMSELFNIERQQNYYYMDLMDKSSAGNWSALVQQTPELGQMFAYDPNNFDDAFLASIDYAPSSFSSAYSQNKIAKALEQGYSAKDMVARSAESASNIPIASIPFGNTITLKPLMDTGAIQPGSYLSQIYQYDMSDPDDVLNKALGLMPKSFKYDNTDEDVKRQKEGLLPQYAEDYVKNSSKFVVEYTGWAMSMQQYADDLADWQYGPNTGFLGWFKGDKPKAPEAPEMVQAVMEYKDLLAAGELGEETEYLTDYEKYTSKGEKAAKIEAPHFYFGDVDNLTLYVDPENPDADMPGYFKGSTQTSETGLIKKELQAQGGGLIKYLEKLKNEGRLTEEQYGDLTMRIVGSQGNLPLDDAAAMIYENDFIQDLKDAGEYEAFKAESDKIYDDMVAVLTEGRNINYETEMAEETKTIKSGQAYKTRKWTTDPESTYTPEKAEVLKKNLGLLSEFVDQPIPDGWAAIVAQGMNDEIRQRLRELGLSEDELNSIGWEPVLPRYNDPKFKYYYDKAGYIATVKEYRNRMDTVDNMKNAPSWLVAIGNGLHNGVSNVGDNLLGLSLEIAKLNPFQDERSRKGLDKLANYVAQSGQYRRGAYIEEMEVAQGGNTWATNALFNITTTATELGITLGAGKVLGTMGGASNAAKAVTGWRGLARKALFSKELVPMFMSSLGSNLMQGQLKGYDDLTNWLVALPTAYFEAKTESMFGFFSKSGSAFKLFKNGVANLSVETLKNFGLVLAENTLGETFEEIIQDTFGSIWESIITGKGDPLSFGDTITTTMGVGLLMTLLGLPGNLKSYANARVVESNFNEAIAAYERGDIEGFKSAIEKMKPALSEAILSLTEDFRTGEIDRQAELMQIDENVAANLDKMETAMRSSMELRQMRENGETVPQGVIDFMDARANEAISALRSEQGVREAPATLYDQIMNSPDLVQMISSNGFTASLIREHGNALLTDEQIQLLRDIDAAAKADDYLNTKFEPGTELEQLDKAVAKYQQKVSKLKAEYKTLDADMKKQLEDAYAVSTEMGQAKRAELGPVIQKLKSLKKNINTHNAKLADATKTQSAYKAQQGYRMLFNGVAQGQTEAPVQAPVSPAADTTERIGQTPGQAETAQEAQGEDAGRTMAYEATFNDIVGDVPPSKRVSKTKTMTGEGGKIATVLESTKKAKPSLREAVGEGIAAFRRQWSDTGQAIWDFGKEIKDKLLYPLYNHAKQSAFEAQNMIGVKQTDINGNVVGPSLMDIYKPVYGDRVTADTYVYHLHNIDRMNLEARGYGENKPVFGESVTSEESARIVAEMEAANPELKAFGEQLIAYHRNILQMKLDTRMISQQEFDYLTNKYPHYVPTDRFVPTTKGVYVLGRSVTIADTIRVAKGSNLDLMPLDESSARKTLRDIEAVNKNMLGIRLFNDAMENTDTASRYVEAVEVEKSDYDPDTEEDQKPSLPNTLRFYMDGEKVTMKVSGPVAFAFKEMTNTFQEYNILNKAGEATTSTIKRLITGYNPVFSARNGIRDLSSAGLNTKFSEAVFARNWAKAVKEITTNGELWQLYKSMGGLGDTFFDYNKGKIKMPSQSAAVNLAKKLNPIHLIETANMAIEQLPRLAEFMATLETGGMSYENKIQALYNAAEVTVNFGRSGKAARYLNKTFVPFLNPSIQGASRFVRRFTETKGSKQWTQLIGRVAALGILPSVINALLYSGDDEWDMINDRDKNRYYLFKLGDGYWVKIPKGREVSLFGAITNQILGLQDADGWGIIDLAAEQVAPVSPIESNILSPIGLAANNRTWYGTPIESESLQQYAPGQRYDESTSAFSKWLGSWTNISPKKIDYLIDSYTGVVGDVLIPASSPKAERGGVLAPAVSAFTLDVNTTNKYSTEFYDMVEDITYRMHSEDKTVVAKAKRQNTIIQRYVSDISDLNKLIRKAQNSDMPDKDKVARVRDLKATISGLQKKALEQIK